MVLENVVLGDQIVRMSYDDAESSDVSIKLHLVPVPPITFPHLMPVLFRGAQKWGRDIMADQSGCTCSVVYRGTSTQPRIEIICKGGNRPAIVIKAAFLSRFLEIEALHHEAIQASMPSVTPADAEALA